MNQPHQTEPETPPTGPRPLPLHLAMATMTAMTSQAALPSLKSGLLNWRPELKEKAESLQKALEDVPNDAFAKALESELEKRLGSFLDGIKQYRLAPRGHRLKEPPAIWAKGTTRLLDYGRTPEGERPGAPLLVVPSLINRAYILDLTERRSLMRALARAGFRPFLVDWGAPGATERHFTLTDYIAGRLEEIVDVTTDIAGCKVGLLGYCMGGLLTLALAQRKPRHVAAMALMATPWDFHAEAMAQVRMLKVAAPQISALIREVGVLPVDVLNGMFASLSPFGAIRKFQAFAQLTPDSLKAKEFIALEDWLNDGVPLAGPVAETCLVDWYVHNAPAAGTWQVGGRPVRPAEIPHPTLVVVPSQDYIVPPKSASVLSDLLPRGERMDVDAGHIGMVVGRGAGRKLFEPLAEWLRPRL